jgi:hypothetical protein
VIERNVLLTLDEDSNSGIIARILSRAPTQQFTLVMIAMTAASHEKRLAQPPPMVTCFHSKFRRLRQTSGSFIRLATQKSTPLKRPNGFCVVERW